MNYIDLGLSVLWADSNIGAENPGDYGDYIQWGEWDKDIQVPTLGQMQELNDNCTWTWMDVNGVKGYKITSKTNGNSIFLPAAGYRNGTSLYYAGSDGIYWSSTLIRIYSSYAYVLYFNSDLHTVNNNYRYYGQSVRPVKEKKDKP